MPSEDAKAVKKVEAEEDNKSLSSFVRKKPTNANNAGSTASRNSSGSRPKPAKKEIDEDDEKKPVSKRNSSAGVSKEKELKKKKTEKDEEAKKKRENKVYDLPGQKRDQPEERDPLRIFYESLYKQVPTSEMAQIWFSPMEKSRESGFLFCNLCGTMLILKSKKYAECPLCKTTRNAKEIIGKQIAYTVSAEDIRTELGISLFGEKTQEEAELPKIKKACEKCQHPELVYTTRQTRSADEGQTTYYTCPNCGHRFTEG